MAHQLNSLQKRYPKRYAQIMDLLCDITGALLYGTAVHTFAESANFAPGGVSGIALLLNHLFALPIGACVIVLNIPLIALSYRIIGKRFLLKSVRSILFCTLFVDLLFPYTPSYTGNTLLAALYYGLFMGTGLALIYMRGSSTGGTDFLILCVKTKFPHLSLGLVTLSIDCCVIGLGGAIFRNLDAVLYGLISTFVVSVMLDKWMYGLNARKLLLIITEKGDEVALHINRLTGRGSTYIQAMGTYSKAQKDIILCACNKAQSYTVTNVIHSIDATAFVMVTETSEVFGEGFIEANLESSVV